MSAPHILITGGAGFIGSELARQAAELAGRVTVVDNLVNGRRENLLGLESACELVVADVRNASALARLMRGVDIVYHLACLGVRHSIHSPAENHEVNASGTLGLLAAARTAGVGRFVYVSTSEVYGTARTVPMTEDHPTRPHTVYGASKLAGECYTRAYRDSYGFPTVVVRPFNAYGPRCHHEGDSGEVIPKFMLRCLAGKPMVIFGDGEQTRDFTYVEDTARGILAAGLSDTAIGRTLNLGSGQEVTVNALAGLIREVTARPNTLAMYDEPRPGDVLRLFADSTEAAQALGFEPKVGFRDGLTRLLDWYVSASVPPERLLAGESVRSWEARVA